MRFSRRLLVGFFLGGLLAPAHAAGFRLTVAPADSDRAGETVTFTVPAGLPRSFLLRDAAGATQVIEPADDGTGSFFVAAQKAGETLTYSLEPAAGAGTPTAVSATKAGGRLHLAVGGRPVFDYQMDADAAAHPGIDAKVLRSGYLHPVYSPAGRLVTDNYPSDHPHHHGIWTAWTHSEFEGRHPDFWNMGKPAADTTPGAVEFVSLDRTWSGPFSAGFVAHHHFLDLGAPKPVAVLDEKWTVTLYGTPGFAARVFDLDLTHTALTDDPLTLPAYRYGGLGVRGAAAWLDKASFSVLSSEGVTTRVPTLARWYYLGGRLDGATAGIVILEHPANIRAPGGLWMNPDQPFYCYTPVQSAAFQITRTQPYAARFRFLTLDGPPDAKFLEACWQGYAHPGAATVTGP